jgi:hypothetical protein
MSPFQGLMFVAQGAAAQRRSQKRVIHGFPHFPKVGKPE